jgi:hypothetical protein
VREGGRERARETQEREKETETEKNSSLILSPLLLQFVLLFSRCRISLIGTSEQVGLLWRRKRRLFWRTMLVLLLVVVVPPLLVCGSSLTPLLARCVKYVVATVVVFFCVCMCFRVVFLENGERA